MASHDSTLVRRVFLQGIGSIAVLVPVACSGEDQNSTSASNASSGNTGGGGASSTSSGMGGTGGDGGSPSVCVLTPEQTEGPFYLDDDLMRTEITEGKPGAPLHVTLRVVQMPDCTPLANIPVDLWHADALGLYSGFPGQGDNADIDTSGETFLRGTAITDGEGTVMFETIWPGWYPGRAIHAHFKVRLPGNMEVTSQLYFPDADNSDAHSMAPYTDHGPISTTNAQDGILNATPDGDALLTEVTMVAGVPTATLTIGIA